MKPSSEDTIKPFPRYTTVSRYRDNVGRSRYHGFQVGLNRRLAGGLSALASYTWSKLVDDASSVFDAGLVTGPVASFPVADSFNRRLERDVSSGDITHNLTAGATWQIPFGTAQPHRGHGWMAVLNDWEAAGMVTLQSGLPLAVAQATNFNAFAGFGTQRPNLVGNPELPAGARNAAGWFNTAAFEEAPQFTLGNSSRNPLRGPGFQSVDLALIRVTAANPVLLEWRVELFNALNHTNLGPPNTVLGAPGFGTITSARPPRVAQLGLRLHF